MNELELNMIEKRFLKISLDKNYLTGGKVITYCYSTEDDYKWHKERLTKSKWEETSKKKKTITLGKDPVDVIQVKYFKQELPDWEKKKRRKEREDKKRGIV